MRRPQEVKGVGSSAASEGYKRQGLGGWELRIGIMGLELWDWIWDTYEAQ